MLELMKFYPLYYFEKTNDANSTLLKAANVLLAQDAASNPAGSEFLFRDPDAGAL